MQIMTGVDQTLEGKINYGARSKFKSEGERRIAYFLDINSIKYQYESGILVQSTEKKPRIWYPDFYLPQFGTYIEYYGLAGQQNYDKGIKTKQSVYSKMGLDVIHIYPWMFTENWQGYIMRDLKRTAKRRYRNLTTKPYWSNYKPSLFSKVTSTKCRYRRCNYSHY